ncbi:MAG: amidohydrolase family protein [Planctomycetes bacterium]|nr:amidohydrolase family protein [Planctomycetota bacterium]
MHIVLSNAIVWPGDGREFEGSVVVRDGVIEQVLPGRYAGPLLTVDCGGLAISPGMIDLMMLGGFNRSVLRDDPLEIAREYLRLGVTAVQLCVGTLPPDSQRGVAENARRAMDYAGDDAAEVLGVYLEGPFQQPELTGASLRQFALPPSRENVARVLDEFGPAVTMINVAPGLPGALEAVRQIRAAGKIVAMAHSDAPAEAVLACVEAGATVLGHAWDNNPGRIGDSGVQQPTLEHVALTDERVRFIHLICDGTHVHPVIVRLTLRCRGVEPLCLVTDAVIRAGCPDGPYASDDGRTFTKQHGVGRTDTGWLAGSALLLPDQFRTFVSITGLPPAQAVRTVTLNPAACLGLDHRIGVLAPGCRADLIAWDPATLRVRRVWRAGREIAGLSDFHEVKWTAE